MAQNSLRVKRVRRPQPAEQNMAFTGSMRVCVPHAPHVQRPHGKGENRLVVVVSLVRGATGAGVVAKKRRSHPSKGARKTRIEEIPKRNLHTGRVVPLSARKRAVFETANQCLGLEDEGCVGEFHGLLSLETRTGMPMRKVRSWRDDG